MILRVFKSASIGILLWHVRHHVPQELPKILRTQSQIGTWPHAIFGTIVVCLVLVLGAVILSNIWSFGSKGKSGGRVYALQHNSVLLYALIVYLFSLLLSVAESERGFSSSTNSISLGFSLVLVVLAATRLQRHWSREDKQSVYGLQHGRLHLDAHVPMWMNMGYWKADEKNASGMSKSMAEACRDLLKLVLAEAGFTKTSEHNPPKLLIDVGFGCGEQTIHLTSGKPIRQYDQLWWDTENHQVYFDQYIGLTQDMSQCQYAQERVDEFKCSPIAVGASEVTLFCADAANPTTWNNDLLTALNNASSKSQETWLLALDTAYHFSPSRWVLVEHARQEFGASFMAFDLCLSPTATLLQKLVIRVLTTLMGAPWANFVTPELYRQKLKDIGYNDNYIKVIDISEHVFAPLAEYMDEQDRKLNMLGLGLGSFKAARLLFKWWGSTGVMRGVVVVAKHRE